MSELNEQRTERVTAVLELYMTMTGEDEEQTSFVDLLTDMRHWHHQNSRLPFSEPLRISEMHFDEEVDEEAE